MTNTLTIRVPHHSNALLGMLKRDCGRGMSIRAVIDTFPYIPKPLKAKKIDTVSH
jgi:hypothetical protein